MKNVTEKYESSIRMKKRLRSNFSPATQKMQQRTEHICQRRDKRKKKTRLFLFIPPSAHQHSALEQSVF
jgi:hypothetical protein